MTAPRKPLPTSLPAGGGGGDDILDRFDSADAAADFDPLPAGTYTAVAAAGGLTTARTGTRGYEVTFRVADGEFAGRRLWKTFFLTPAALAYSKRDLAKLGLTTKDHLTRPFPAGRLVCRLVVVVRARDDGSRANEVKSVDVIRVQDPPADPFAPGGDGDAGGPTGGGATDFPYGAGGDQP